MSAYIGNKVSNNTQFRESIETKAIIVERGNGAALYWFWPLAASIILITGYFLFDTGPLATMAMAFFALCPLATLLWLELNGRFRDAVPLLTWHGGRLFLFEKGRHIKTLHSQQIKHIEMAYGRNYVQLLIHATYAVIDQKIQGVNRGQRLQIQRIVRCLQADLAFKAVYDTLPEDLVTLEQEINSRY